MNRMTQHPFLEVPVRRSLTFYYNGRPLQAREGDTVAAALTANGIRVFRYTRKREEPRGLFCGTGQCGDCMMVVNGKPNVRTCMTQVEESMRVETQGGAKGNADERV